VELNLVLAIGIITVIGFLGGRVAERLRFPRITGYIIIGILLSPSVLNVISGATIENLDIITDVALGIIAFLIGGSLRLESLRKLGRSIAWITPFECLGAWCLVTLLLAFLGPRILTVPNATFYGTYFPMALVIGSIAGATAPAATIAVINEYKAKGPFTTTLLSVVAIDDAVTIVTFAIGLGIALPLASGAGEVSFYQMLGAPLLHIVQSMGIGAAFAFALVYIARLVRTRPLLLVVVFGMIMACTGVSNLLGVSLILANMAAGFIVVNRLKESQTFLVLEEIEDVIFAMFFVLAGLHFDLSVMKMAGPLALLIILGRFSGQYFGARAGATIAHSSDKVKKYLGLALQPQAGVTIGLALVIQSAFPALGDVMFNAVLAAIIINELYSPPLTKYTIFKVGEASASA
jgi:Kef-type K+ transport system membrane component KefB